MARGILSFFGGAAIIIGFLVMAFGLLTEKGAGLLVTLPIGAGLLIAGAPLLGFARVIDLLEEISRNTSTVSTNTMTSTSISDAERAKSYIRYYKPAMSMSRVCEVTIGGEARTFNTEGEAIAYVLSRKQGESWP